MKESRKERGRKEGREGGEKGERQNIFKKIKKKFRFYLKQTELKSLAVQLRTLCILTHISNTIASFENYWLKRNITKWTIRRVF